MVAAETLPQLIEAQRLRLAELVRAAGWNLQDRTVLAASGELDRLIVTLYQQQNGPR